VSLRYFGLRQQQQQQQQTQTHLQQRESGVASSANSRGKLPANNPAIGMGCYELATLREVYPTSATGILV
jgi:hypothetical protein